MGQQNNSELKQDKLILKGTKKKKKKNTHNAVIVQGQD
jgi:hypothetical protein